MFPFYRKNRNHTGDVFALNCKNAPGKYYQLFYFVLQKMQNQEQGSREAYRAAAAPAERPGRRAALPPSEQKCSAGQIPPIPPDSLLPAESGCGILEQKTHHFLLFIKEEFPMLHIDLTNASVQTAQYAQGLQLRPDGILCPGPPAGPHLAPGGQRQGQRLCRLGKPAPGLRQGGVRAHPGRG